MVAGHAERSYLPGRLEIALESNDKNSSLCERICIMETIYKPVCFSVDMLLLMKLQLRLSTGLKIGWMSTAKL